MHFRECRYVSETARLRRGHAAALNSDTRGKEKLFFVDVRAKHFRQNPSKKMKILPEMLLPYTL